MSHHEGVSCDSCLKRNFQGKRYKCLKCPDYDLCSTCHDSGTLSGRHTSQHPMQCILTRNDLELFFAGEMTGNDLPYSFTCPLCGLMGFTDATLLEHVNFTHVDNTNNYSEVVCPICATLPDGEPNQVFHDFLNHLNVEHRGNNNNANRELEEPQMVRIRQRHVRMSSRNRRSQFLNSNSTANTSNNRETIDGIAQLLSQLSDVRRVNNSSSNGQNLWQFPFDRQSNPDRSSLERIIQRQRRHLASTFSTLNSASTQESNSNQLSPYVLLEATSPSANNNIANSVTGKSTKFNSNYLLNTCASMLSQENELKKLDTIKIDRSIFVQELIFACLSDAINTDNILVSKSSEDEVKAAHSEYSLNDSATKSSSKNNNNETNEVNNKENCNNESNHQMIADDLDKDSSTTVQERIEMQKDCENETNNNNKINITLEPDVTNKNLESKVICGTTPSNTTTFSLQSELENRQKSMPPSLVTSTGTSPSFIVPTQTVNHNTSSRNNKVNKVRPPPAINPSTLTLRSAATINVVPPGGRRKILKQSTEPPPHYD